MEIGVPGHHHHLDGKVGFRHKISALTGEKLLFIRRNGRQPTGTNLREVLENGYCSGRDDGVVSVDPGFFSIILLVWNWSQLKTRPFTRWKMFDAKSLRGQFPALNR